MSKLFVDEIVHQSSQGSGTITIGASGETISIPSGATLTVPNGGLTGQNYPAFQATNLTNYTGKTASVSTLSEFATTTYDTDSAFDTSAGNYKFTVPSGKSGKYYFYSKVVIAGDSAAMYRVRSSFYLNGSVVTTNLGLSYFVLSTFELDQNNLLNFITLDLSDGDYVQIYSFGSPTSGTWGHYSGSIFGAFRIGA